ncbi:hypothetical protein [Maliponia aquimaris]|uniref:Lipoprotein n=1 Tax=Maliponia aquimaris TaxID=1673631 RepID=A0A238JZ68_9RHOB|nr:hypothetical protein [Maliponia aquimaris]SMX35940.1 hypothetical protein MAA8898_00697 [Maliponia aquimaris]
MHRIVGLLASFGLLAGCLAPLYGDGAQVGSLNGQPLYEARCTVDLSTAGQKGLFGTGTVPLHGTCDIAAENRCGNKTAYTTVSVDRSNRRRVTDTFDNGPYRQTRTYTAEDQVLRFTCKG